MKEDNSYISLRTGQKPDCGKVSSFCPERPLYRFVYWLILHIFPPMFRMCYGYRVKGKIPEEAMKAGCVTVCNHVHMLDCVMLGCAFSEYTMQFLTLQSNLKIPVAGQIVRLMGGIGLPFDLTGWRSICGRVEKAFSQGQILQIYPEGERISGCRELREFKPGAFTLAVKYAKPVIPCMLRFYPRFRKNGRPKRDGIELVILRPVYPEPGLKGKAAAEELQKQVREQMESTLSERAFSCAQGGISF